MRPRGTDEMGSAEGRTCQDMERMRPSEGDSPLKTAEEGIRCDKRPREER